MPYESPQQSSVLSNHLPHSNAASLRSQGSMLPLLYEEPKRAVPIMVPRDYEPAAISGTEVTYSSVDDASIEMENYLKANGYPALQNPIFDRDQHISTQPLKQTSNPQNELSGSESDIWSQEPTYFTLEDRQNGGSTNLSSPYQEEEGEGQEQGGGSGGEDVPFSETELTTQAQEHTYFTLDNEGGGIKPVNQEGESGDIEAPLYFHLVQR